VYAETVKKRTNMNVDLTLLEDAKRVLHTKGQTDTVHAALESVVRREKLERLARRAFEDLTPHALEEMRRPRTAEIDAPHPAAR
jgi:Arc/MetJ family transcription regulator